MKSIRLELNLSSDHPMNNKISLLIIYPMQFGHHTDTYKYCDHLKYKYQMTYVCFDQGFEKIELPGVNVIYMPYNTGKIKRLIHFFKYIIKLTRKQRFEIIFTVHFKFCFIIGLFATANVKVLDYRSGDLNLNKLIRKLKNQTLGFDSFFFRNISVISEGVRDILNINPIKTLILPLGGDTFSIKAHNFCHMDLLYVGHLHIRHIYQTIEGVSLFIKRNINVANIITYTIIGFGNPDDEEIISNYIHKFNLENVVHFLGRKKYTDLPEYFDKCNIGVSYIPITPYYEHQPATKTFEYANSGLFTIATNTCENRKVITDHNGVLCKDDPVSFSEAMEKVYNQMDSINENDIRSSLQTYQWNRIVTDILEPYLLRKLNETSKI